MSEPRRPNGRIGPWDGYPSDQRLLRHFPSYLACLSLLLPVACAPPAPVVPEGSAPPQLLWSPPLAYPPALRRSGVTGAVMLEAMVDTAGRIEPASIKVVSSSRKAFEGPAVDMLRESRFRPAHDQAGPVRMLVRVPVKFALGREGVSPTDSVAAATRITAGERLAKDGRIHEAMTEYAAAQGLDPRLAVSAPFWYGLCWYGSVWGYAADVMSACNQAVELEADRARPHDARAIARILTGDFTGAIADLELFVRATTNAQERSQRSNWIAQLRAGQNPLTPDVLRALRER